MINCFDYINLRLAGNISLLGVITCLAIPLWDSKALQTTRPPQAISGKALVCQQHDRQVKQAPAFSLTQRGVNILVHDSVKKMSLRELCFHVQRETGRSYSNGMLAPAIKGQGGKGKNRPTSTGLLYAEILGNRDSHLLLLINYEKNRKASSTDFIQFCTDLVSQQVYESITIYVTDTVQ